MFFRQGKVKSGRQKGEMEGTDGGRGRGRGWSGSSWSGPGRGLRGRGQAGGRGYQGQGQLSGSISLSKENKSLLLRNTCLTLEGNVKGAMAQNQEKLATS